MDRCYSWNGKNENGVGAQIDLILECDAARTDYLCEMKFAESAYSISADYNLNLRNKLSVFSNCRQHNKTHSIQIVMVTSFGLVKGVHSGIVNHSVILDQLFK